MGHGLEACPGAARRQVLAQGIGIVGGIAKQDVALPERGQHIGGGATVMRLAFGQLSAIGRPQASTSAWILVVRPPRERPMQRDRSAFFGCWRRADARGCWRSRSS